MNASQELHPTDQTLHAYGLGKLDDGTADSISHHLESCPDCQRRVAELSSDSFLGRLRDAQGRPDSPAAVMSSNDGVSMLGAGPGSPAPPPASTLPPGLADHPDYEITRELGRGGMGVVYMARNRLMGRTEVLKVVSSHLVNRRGVLDRFLSEIRNAARLDHPNVVTAYTVIRAGESLVLAMQYVEGLDLAQVVKARGPLPVAQACNYVHQSALGLQHAHEHGMVHRDIKPSNLMLTRQGDRALIKVLDFGLAKIQSEGDVDGGLTHEGQMLGTPDYIAPEQISDARRSDIRADIYSLGCTLYYLLTGGPPFRGTSLYDILQAHHSMDAKPLNLARPEVPVELAALVAKMMAKEPERRFQEPKEVAQALTPFFKKASAASAGSTQGLSGAGRPDAKPAATAPGSGALIEADRPPFADPSLSKPVEASPPGGSWQILVEVQEPERLADTRLATHSHRPPAWLWPAVASAVVLVGFLVAWWGTGSVRIKTPEGIIVLEDLPDQSVVLVDGKKATVQWLDGGGSAEITVAAGDHEVQVKKDRFTTFGQKVTLESGGRTVLTARLEPLEPSPSKEGAARVKAARPDASEPGPIRALDAALALRGHAEVISGRWLVEGNELVQTDAAKPYEFGLMFGDRQWTDYDFTVDLMREKGHDCAFLHFRNDGEGKSLLNFEISSGRRDREDCRITVYSDGKERNLGGQPFRLVDHTWYTARVRARHNRIECTLFDGEKEVIHLSKIENDHLSGRVGLGTERASYRFKNIRVTGPDGGVLWEMPPDIGELSGRPDGRVAAHAASVGDTFRESTGTSPPAPVAKRAGSVPNRVRAKDATQSPQQKATILFGSWRVERNELVQSSEEGTILLGDAPLASFDMRFKGQIISGNEGFGALFHRTRGDNVRFFHVGESAGTEIQAGFLHEGKEGGQSQPIATVKGRWYNVLVKVRGAEFWCYLDGRELFHDVDERFERGRIGLATWDARARFRDIVITAPDGEVVWEGLPDLAPAAPGKGSTSAGAGEGPAPTAKRAMNEPDQRQATPTGRSPRRTAKVVYGSWKLDGKELVGTNPGQGLCILVDDPSLSRFDIKFSAMIVEGNFGFSAIFHYTSLANYRNFHVGEDRGKGIELGCVYKNNWHRYDGKFAAIPVVTGRWYDVLIKVRGPECATFVSGRQVFEHSDDTFSKGRVGLGVHDCAARFRDISITTVDRKVLWNGPPDRIVDAKGKVLWEAPAE